MNNCGIRLSDANKGILTISLKNVLNLLPHANSYKWSILWLEASGVLGAGKSMIDFENEIRKSSNGFFIEWEELNLLADKFFQIIELCVIGCENENSLKKYPDVSQMYEQCDVIILLIDGSFWEIRSKDILFIENLKSNFKDIEMLKDGL